LLNANKKIDKAIEKNEKGYHLRAQQQQKRPSELRRAVSTTATGAATPGKFNYFMTPPLSRTSSMANSTPGTPHYGSDVRSRKTHPPFRLLAVIFDDKD